MASVNRESLRRSFDEQKRTFERLKRDGAMTPESIAPIDALMTLLELLIAVFMEKTTTKASRSRDRMRLAQAWPCASTTKASSLARWAPHRACRQWP